MFRKSVLNNGVRVITEQFPHSRVVSLGIWIDVGSRDEHDLNNGCAHFAEHMFFKGTTSRSAHQIAKEFDGLGGAANAFTSRESTCLYGTVMDIHLPKLVELLSDLFLNSLFTQEDIERERQVILQEISMVEDTPDDQIHDLFEELLWHPHPLARTVLGTRAVVGTMDSAKLVDYVSRLYRPEKIVIAVAGNVDHQSFLALVDEGFSHLPQNLGPAPVRHAPVLQKPSRQAHYRDLEQVHMLLGAHGLSSVHADRYAYLLLNILLGGNMSSRLFQEIREKRGLAYAIYSDIVSYADCGYLAVYLGVEPESVEKTLMLVRREIARLQREEVPAAELDNVKNFVKGGLYLAAENMDSIMTRIARNEISFGRYLSIDEVATAIDLVQGKEINALAEQIFGHSALTVSSLGPLSPEAMDRLPLGG